MKSREIKGKGRGEGGREMGRGIGKKKIGRMMRLEWGEIENGRKR